MTDNLNFNDVVKTALTETEQVEAQKHETVVDDGLAGYIAIGEALGTIREGHLHVGPFREYVVERFDIEYPTAVRRIIAARVALNLKAAGLSIPSHEDQAYQLHDLDADEQPQVWRKILKQAKKDGVRVTTKLILEVLGKKPQRQTVKKSEARPAEVALPPVTDDEKPKAPSATASETVETAVPAPKPGEEHENSVVAAFRSAGKAVAALQLTFQAVENTEMAGGEVEHLDAMLSEIINLVNGIRGRLLVETDKPLKLVG